MVFVGAHSSLWISMPWVIEFLWKHFTVLKMYLTAFITVKLTNFTSLLQSKFRFNQLNLLIMPL